MEVKTRDALIKSAEVSSDGGHVIAYASTFDREPDSYGDVVAKGAFLKSLQRHRESGEKIPLLWGHDTKDPYNNLGVIESADEDERGLKVDGAFDPENDRAQYVRRLVKEGRVSKLSFAYRVLDQAPVRLEDGTKANELREVELLEVSLVQNPANSHASVVEAKADGTDEPEDEPEGEQPGGDEPQDGTEKAISDARAAVQAAADAIAGAIQALDAISGDDADEGEGGEDPDEGNLPSAKARELISKIARL